MKACLIWMPMEWEEDAMVVFSCSAVWVLCNHHSVQTLPHPCPETGANSHQVNGREL